MLALRRPQKKPPALSRRTLFKVVAGGLVAPSLVGIRPTWAQMTGMIPRNAPGTTLAQRLATNNAAMPGVISAASAGSKLLEVDDLYELSEQFTLPGDIAVRAKRRGTCGFELHDNTKSLFRVDGGAGAEYGGMEGLFFSRTAQPTIAQRGIPTIFLTGAIHGYWVTALDMKVGGVSIQLEKDGLGRYPYGLWARECRFSGHGSAIFSKDVTNGTRVNSCNFNGGYWDMSQHYDKGNLSLLSGPGWMPVPNFLVELAGEGGDGVIINDSIANFAGGIFKSRNTTGNCVGVEIYNSWTDAASVAFAHFGGVNTRDVTLVNNKLWTFFGPNWSNGAYFETFSHQGVRKVRISNFDGDGISGVMGLTITRPDYSNSSVLDILYQNITVANGGRASPGNLRMLEFAGANVDYARIDGAWGSGYGGHVGGDGNVTNRNFQNMGTLPPT